MYVNERQVATRKAGDHVGEMAFINSDQPRSSTVIAKSEILALKIESEKFDIVNGKFPEICKVFACELAVRLNDRSQNHTKPNAVPRVFIASSSEYLKLAKKFEAGMNGSDLEVVLWTSSDVFSLTSTTIESLTANSNSFDFWISLLRQTTSYFIERRNILQPEIM